MSVCPWSSVVQGWCWQHWEGRGGEQPSSAHGSPPAPAHGAASVEPYLKQENMPMARNRAARDVE